MVQDVTIRLPSLPLIDNDERVLATFSVPTVQDIRLAIIGNTVDRLDIEEVVEDVLDDQVVPQLTSILQTTTDTLDAVEEITIPEPPAVDTIVSQTVEDVRRPIETQLDRVVDSLTGEITDVVGNIDQALADEFDDVASGVQGAVDRIGQVGDAVATVETRIGELNDIGADVVEDRATAAVSTVLDETIPDGLLDDPIGFIETRLDERDSRLPDDLEQRLSAFEDND